MLNSNILRNWKSDVAAVGFIVICLGDKTALILGVAPLKITLSSPTSEFIEKSKMESAKELLNVRLSLDLQSILRKVLTTCKAEFLYLATPGEAWSLKRYYFDALPLSVRFGSRV